MDAQPTIRPITAEQTIPLRHSVLWPDYPVSHVLIPDDAAGQHFGAFIGSEPHPVCVISLFINPETKEARFRKFATDPAWQRKGVGSKVLEYTIEKAVEGGAEAIWCDARTSAEGFYGRFGMVREGAEFFKGHVPNVEMRRVLKG